MTREIRSFDYVNHPYEVVRAALQADTVGIVRAATMAATSRAVAVASELHVQLAGLDISAPIELAVDEISETNGGATRASTLRVPIRWKAAQRPALFPVMDAELVVYPLTGSETQLDFLGRYEPPLGLLGATIDAAIGHRIAEASVQRFVAEVAQHLRMKLIG